MFYYIYIPFFVYKGQTVGKRICKVKIIQNNNQEVSLKSLVLRQGLGMIVIEGIFVSASALWHQLVSLCIHVNIVSMMMYVGFVVGGISTLMIIFTKEHRAIHDYIGNTKVVSVWFPIARKRLYQPKDKEIFIIIDVKILEEQKWTI